MFKCVRQVQATPSCDSQLYDSQWLLPGPKEPGYDAELNDQATLLERQFHAFNAHGVQLSAEVSLRATEATKRQQLEDFLAAPAEWDFEAFSGQPVSAVIEDFHKVAGAYGGAGIAADAYRYGTLRDQGAECAEVDRARAFLIADLDALHLVTAITGK
jgi:hypothetical protein